MALRRIQKELRDLRQSAPCNCSVKQFDDDDIYHWTATLPGPEGTPYEGGLFSLDIGFSREYPFKPPRVKFTTRIYHPSISSRGELLTCMLYDDWSPALTVSKVFMEIVCMLNDPDPTRVFDHQIAEEFKNNRELFNETARDWTKRYAVINMLCYRAASTWRDLSRPILE
jgi:ubiquitin-conjugating enzyme E2 D/E